MSSSDAPREPIEAAIARLKTQGAKLPILIRRSGPIRAANSPAAKPPSLPRQSR